MTDQKTNNAQENPAVAAKPAAAPVAKAVEATPPAAKVPAAKPAVKKPVTKPAAKPAAVPATPATAAAATAKPRVARKRSAVDETVDKHQKVLADALEQAQAITYPKTKHLKQPGKPAKAEKSGKPEKSVKTKKTKLVRDSFAMPENEYAHIAELKKRLAGEFKKSELLRAGIAVLTALNDAELKAVMGHIERIKTGRPAKK